MNKKKYDKALSTLKKLKLDATLKDIMDDAEEAWKLQRELIKLIDYKDDAVQGEIKLRELIDALNMWILRLEILEDDAKKVAKRANKALHERRRDFPSEEDVQGYGHIEDVTEAVEVIAEDTQVKRPFLRRGGRCNGGLGAYGNTDKSIGKVINKRIDKSLKKGRKVSCGEH